MSHFSINSIIIYEATSPRLRKILQPGKYKFEGGLVMDSSQRGSISVPLLV